jgi:hypothetical protein
VAPVRQRDPEKNELIISYMYLRKTVGWIGTLLPVVLLAGNTIFTTSLPGSMSGYYYTHMRNVFVGALCALGVFLLAYDGYDEVDRWITNIAGLGAIGVAFCPTKPAVRPLTVTQQVVGDVHLFFAAVTFIALGLMALRFAKPAPTPEGQTGMSRIWYGLGLAAPSRDQPAKKKLRTTVYRACGCTILACVLLAAASNLLPASVKAYGPWLFIFEALAVFAFGVSWFVKGQTLLPTAQHATAALRATQPARPAAPHGLPAP